MADSKPMTRLRWSGPESIRAAKDLTAKHTDFELELPANLHHALFAHLHPGAEPGEPEEVDALGGAHLLSRVAEIGGFSNISELIDPIEEANATVHVVSPLPKVIVEFQSSSHQA